MNIERRNRFAGHGSTVVKNRDKFSGVNLDNFVLNMMCRYVVSANTNIRRGQLINLRNLIYSVNPETYMNDIERNKMVSFIKTGVDARLNHGLTDPQMILMQIHGGIDSESNEDDIADLNHDLPRAEVTWLGNMISESLKYGYLYSYADRMIDICTKFKTGDYGNKSAIVKEFESLTAELQTQFRRAKNEEEQESMFSLKDGIFLSTVREVHDDLNNPRNFLKTGMQGMNDMLGGGFECGRLYVYFGLPGEGKSTTLLNLCYQMKKHNRFYQTKDPTKTPCIVLLTMENKVKESVNRLFDVSTRAGSLRDVDPEQAVQMMQQDGELYLSDDNPIDIIIKFKPTNSIDTSYLYTLVEDLEDEGYEVVCMVQDYIGRIRSVDHSADLRLEYGNVVDEMKVFANIKDIPVISASQLNRDASKHIDEARKSNKNDLVRLMGRSNVSESMLILNNCDGAFMLAPEFTPDGKKYLGVQKVKSRFLPLKRLDYVYLPYEDGSEISLIEDADLATPLYKTSLRNDELRCTPKQSPYHTNKIVELGQIVNNDGDSPLFNNSFVSSEEMNSVACKMNLLTPIVFEAITFEKRTG